MFDEEIIMEYRVVKTRDEEGYEWFDIRPIYYTDDGAAWTYADVGSPAMGESLAELKLDMDMMKEAFKKPVMSGNDVLVIDMDDNEMELE